MAGGHGNIRLTVPEMVGLADRMIGRGNSIVLRDQPEFQRDLLLAGRIIAHLLVTEVINAPIELP